MLSIEWDHVTSQLTCVPNSLLSSCRLQSCGMASDFLILKVEVLTAPLCPTLCDPHGLYSPPGFSVYGILQTRMLQWVAIPFSRGSSRPSNQAWISSIAGRFFTI